MFEGGGEVVFLFRGEVIFYIMRWIRNGEVGNVLSFSDHSSFETREGKIETIDFGDGERVFFGVAFG